MDTANVNQNLYHLPFPSAFDPGKHDAGTLHEYLAAHGVAVHGVSVTEEGVTVESEDDPTAILAAFDPAPSERELLVQQLNAINLNTATTAKLREAVALLKELVT